MDAIAEVDALVAHTFGLEREEMAHVLETFHRGWDPSKPDYADRYKRVMNHYDRWAEKA
jgi:hypothetical protein